MLQREICEHRGADPAPLPSDQRLDVELVAAEQLVTDREGLIPSLPAPKCEFAIIAGARHNPAGWNPFIPGDDDGTVTVESTKLVGAADFSTVRSPHTSLLRNREALDQTLRFLSEGRLCADRPAQAITDDSEKPANSTALPKP